MSSIEPLMRPVASLRPDETNLRRHGEESIVSIVTSLTQFGQQKPIVVLKSGKVIAGNGMLEAAKRVGLVQLAVVEFDDDSEQAARAFAFADNRTAELSTWDESVLAKTLEEVKQDGFDAASYGWGTDLLDDLLDEKKNRELQERIQQELSKQETLQFDVVLTVEQAKVVREALKLARHRGAEDAAAALVEICRRP